MSLYEEFEVAEDIKTAKSLPPSAYSDIVFHVFELENIFRRNWLLAPLYPLGQTSGKGEILADALVGGKNCAPFELIGQPLLLTLTDDGKLSCLPNVCTHRGFPLVERCETRKKIVCRQHARQFSLDGKCVKHIGFEGRNKFPGEEDHLKEIPVRVWNESFWRKFFFVSLGKGAPDFDQVFKEIRRLVPSFPEELSPQPFERTQIRTVPGNWKLHVENYLDNFHIPTIHRKSLGGAIDMESYTTDLFPHSTLQWVYAKDPRSGFDTKDIPEYFYFSKKTARPVFALWWFVFPNMAFNFYPWGLSVNVWMPSLESPEETVFHWYHLVGDKSLYEKRDELWMNAGVDQEDVEAIEKVALGMRSGLAARSGYAPEKERAIHWFHRKISRAMNK